MNSFFDYVEGSATATYRAAVDQAAELAEQQKRKVDPIHHEKIDRLLDTYAEVISYNKKNLERELQNESRQHDRQQGKVKRREEEI